MERWRSGAAAFACFLLACGGTGGASVDRGATGGGTGTHGFSYDFVGDVENTAGSAAHFTPLRRLCLAMFALSSALSSKGDCPAVGTMCEGDLAFLNLA